MSFEEKEKKKFPKFPNSLVCGTSTIKGIFPNFKFEYYNLYIKLLQLPIMGH